MLVTRRMPEITLRLIAGRSSTIRNFSKKSKDSDSSDDEKVTKITKKSTDASTSNTQEETAAEKLNRLLASMSTDDPYKLSKYDASSAPGSMNRKRREAFKEEIDKEDILKAANRVASLVDDEQQRKQTESELLAKLLGNAKDNMENVNSTGKKGASDNEISLSELIVGMKIDRNPQRQDNLSRSDYVRRTLAAARNQQQHSSKTHKYQPPKREAETFTGSVNLYGGEALGIFKNPNDFQESPDMLSTWNELHRKDLKLQVAHPPSNYFEKIAVWTDQGKVWRFPIDNEQDWQLEETNVDFSEHIFLEQHLESWCPTKGPIRHFMELVCVGLSKNPYITARKKMEHILWYRDYFTEKREMLKEYMIHETPKKRLTEKETH